MATSPGALNLPTNFRSFQTVVAAVSSLSSQILSNSVSEYLLRESRPESSEQTIAVQDLSSGSINASCRPLGCVAIEDDTAFNCRESSPFKRKLQFSSAELNEVRSWPSTPWKSIGATDRRVLPHKLVQFRGPGYLLSWGTRGLSNCVRGSARDPGGGQFYNDLYWNSGQPKNGFLSTRIWQNSRRGHVGHSHDHRGERDKTGKAGERILGWGLWSDIFLAIGKGGAGFVSGSTAIIADAAHSVSDIALSGVALWSSKVANAPKDKEHPYGHGKFETVGALGISGVLLLTGGGIAWHAVETLQAFMPMVSEFVHTATDHLHEHGHVGGGHQHSIDLEHPFVALSAAVVSIVVKEGLYWQTKRVGERQNSELLKASAWHHRSDAISSVVAFIGVGGTLLGMPLLDPVAGLLVSGMIVKAGMETGYQSLQELVDSGVSESVLSPIRSTVLRVHGVEGCHHLRGRRMGSVIHVDAHIEVDPWLSVSAAYNIGVAVRHQLQKEHPEVAETFVHIEPADGGSKTLTHNEAESEAQIFERETGHHDQQQGIHEGLPGHRMAKKDRRKDGSKCDLLESTSSPLVEQHGAVSSETDSRQHSEVEQDVRQVVASGFKEKMSISHVTSHFLQGKVVVEVEVLMNPDISVRHAMEYANDAEEAILKGVSDISTVFGDFLSNSHRTVKKFGQPAPREERVLSCNTQP